MVRVFICEDDKTQLNFVTKTVENTILMEEYDMELELSTSNPQDILDFLQNNPATIGIYILDVDLHHELSGIDLAAKIREYDNTGNIIFVTTHSELTYLTFIYKVEAMDYIIKNNREEMQRRITECLRVSNERFLQNTNPNKKIFKLKVQDKIKAIDLEDIMFFETATTPHKIILHLNNSQIEFYGAIKEMDKSFEEFYRCHKSFVINKNNIVEIDTKNHMVILKNGEECPYSVRLSKGLINK